MSTSKKWTEWHLTPRGWERGTEKDDFRRIDREPPGDRVLTVRYQKFLGSVYSKTQESLITQWESSDEPTVAQLEQEFGPPPLNL
jgi:hypothetical protein